MDISGVRSPLDGKVGILNTWGRWGPGEDGIAWMYVRDAARALDERGEIAFAQRRTWRPRSLGLDGD